MRVLVTGSSKGIGRETAIAFALQGADVCLHGRDPSHLESAVAAVVEAQAALHKSDRGSVIQVLGDLSDADACSRVVSEAVAGLGGLDVLVNNAGIAMRGRFRDVSPDVWRRVISINTLGPAYVTHAAMAHLAASRGSVIFISSAVALWGFPNVSAYAASKYALTGLVQSLQSEVAPLGVHVGVIYVGFTRNDTDKAILGADGRPFAPTARSKALDQSDVARAVVRMARKRRNSMTLSAGARATSFLARFAPWLLRFGLRRASAQIERLSR